MRESEKYIEQFNAKLKKYSTNEVAKIFSSFNRYYYKHCNERPLTRNFSEGYRSFELIILPWLFNGIIFASTAYNDYRSDISEDQAWELYLLYHKYFNAIEGEYADVNYSDPSKNILTPIIYGHMQEQAIYQVSMGLFINRFNRNYYMLKNVEIDKIDLSALVKNKYQMDLDSFIRNLCLIAVFSSVRTVLNSDEVLQYIDDKETYLKIVNDSSISYEDCRSFKSNIDIFRIHPILQTSNGEYIVPNVNTMYFNLGDKLYWLFKDHFRKSTTFVNQFGIIFENYVFEILTKQYGIDKVERLDIVNGEKSADIIIKGEKYKFLIEIKSGVAGAEAKLQELNQEILVFYIKNNIVDAMEQLDASAKRLGNSDDVVCIILNYDLSFMEDSLLMDISSKYQPKHFDNNRLLFFNIDDFEMLICKYNDIMSLETLFDSFEGKELKVHRLIKACEIHKDCFFEDVFNKHLDNFLRKNKNHI